MKYSFEEITIGELTDWVDNKKIDLNPSYQRNFIWSTKDQSELIDTILKGYPLPNFFIYRKTKSAFEMVDGQQRTTTLYNFIKGKISSTKEFGKKKIHEVDPSILEYKLPVIFLSELKSTDSLNEFYVLINKKGKHLNVPEVNKSAFHDKRFLQLANELLSHQEFIDLNLFTEATSKRMNDRAFVEELLGYLKLGIRDKKSSVETLMDQDISEEEYEILKEEFIKVIHIIHRWNEQYPLKNTRYKQKNDFYTLFSFVEQNSGLDSEVLLYQYRILLFLNKEDDEGRQFIRPTNDQCEVLKEYAIHCVSQSNSKSARLRRLEIFNSLLKNKEFRNNEDLKEVLTYLGKLYGNNNIGLKKIGDFELLDLEKLPND